MKFRLNWKITVFSAVCLGTFTWLGFWQMDRGDEKTRLVNEVMARREQPAVPLSILIEKPEAPDGTPVLLEGTWDPDHVFLLDNRVLEGRVGFEVLVPFHDHGSDTHLLVNRGFVPMGRTRQEVPDIPPLTGAQQVTGYVYVAEDNVVVDTGGELVGQPPWPIIVQVADPVLLQLELDRALYPHVIRLADSDPNALPRNWPVTTILPARHWGYAVQWFVMGFVVLAAWLAFSFRRSEDTKRDEEQDN
ncbi:MAG: SURF1 family protein [Pseudomonadales bacterium]|nr:SURF1 family protein [Pseudomonadales bacterium]